METFSSVVLTLYLLNLVNSRHSLTNTHMQPVFPGAGRGQSCQIVSLEGTGFGHFSLISIRSIVKFRKVFVITLIISAYFFITIL